MRKGFVNAIPVLMVILTIFIFNAIASAPTTMVYQGRLADVDGKAIVAETVAIFTIYSTLDGSSTSAIWAEEIPVIPGDQGVFTVELGLTVPLTTAIFDGNPRYLGIKISEDAEMTPRQLLASTPYAINSNIADGSIQFTDIGQNAASANQIIKWNGTTWTAAADAGGTPDDNSVTSAKIVNGAIMTEDIADGQVASANITDGSIQFTDIGQNRAITDQIIKWNGAAWTAAADAGGTPDDNSVTSAKITNGAILTEDIADGQVTSAKITNGAILTEDIADGQVTSANITDGSIQFTDIGQNRAITDQIIKWNGAAWTAAADAGGTPDDNSVTSAKIADGAIMTEDIADGSIQFTDIGQNAASANQIIKWNGTAWKAAADAGGTPDDNSVTSAKIADGAIMNDDIGNLAAISPLKISGTAATLNGMQKFTETNTFFDSTIIISKYGVRMGDNIVPAEADGVLLTLNRDFNHTTGLRRGIWGDISTSGDGGGLIGAHIWVKSTAAKAGSMYGIYAQVEGNGINYAGYFYAYGTGTNYAGYFNGNVDVNGTLSKSAGAFKIDHPLDPANKYLSHSFVESPDMMNVYNGNVITDRSGYAVVDLPDYFNALNKDFRYQLTVIGDFAQAIVAEEINGNQFTIRTDKPSIKVSWQVTGIRKDAYAEQNRIQVEIDKPAVEKGKYLHPEVYQLGEEMQIHYQMNKEARQADGDSHE